MKLALCERLSCKWTYYEGGFFTKLFFVIGCSIKGVIFTVVVLYEMLIMLKSRTFTGICN